MDVLSCIDRMPACLHSKLGQEDLDLSWHALRAACPLSSSEQQEANLSSAGGMLRRMQSQGAKVKRKARLQDLQGVDGQETVEVQAARKIVQRAAADQAIHHVAHCAFGHPWEPAHEQGEQWALRMSNKLLEDLHGILSTSSRYKSRLHSARSRASGAGATARSPSCGGKLVASMHLQPVYAAPMFQLPLSLCIHIFPCDGGQHGIAQVLQALEGGRNRVGHGVGCGQRARVQARIAHPGAQHGLQPPARQVAQRVCAPACTPHAAVAGAHRVGPSTVPPPAPGLPSEHSNAFVPGMTASMEPLVRVLAESCNLRHHGC